MLEKIMGYGVVLALAGVLLFGVAYIVLQPQMEAARATLTITDDSAQTEQLVQDEASLQNDTPAQIEQLVQDEPSPQTDLPAQTPLGAGYNAGGVESLANWETIQGVVIATEPELLLRTDAGEVHIGMGPSFYWQDEAGFSAEVGDTISVFGYYEDDEFKAGEVHNLTTNAQVMLREMSGRPAWSGRGGGQNASGRRGIGGGANTRPLP